MKIEIKQLNITMHLELDRAGYAPLHRDISDPTDPPALEWSETLCDGERVDYEAAEKACRELGEGWRLPTRQELERILDLNRHDPAIDTDKFPDTKSSSYWTSTPTAWNTSAVWVVNFDHGFVYYHNRLGEACVRAVRSSQ